MEIQELHEATEEWLRWRQGVPSFFPTISEMPYLTCQGFEFLCGRFGKADIGPLGQDSHMLMLQREMEKVYSREGSQG